MKIRRSPVDYHDEKLKIELTSLIEYGHAYIIPKDHCASALFITADLKLYPNVNWVAATLFQLCLLLTKTILLELALLVKETFRYGIWSAYHDGRRAELFYGLHAVLDEHADAMKILLNMSFAYERPASISVQLLLTTFGSGMFTFPGYESLNEEKNRNCGVQLWLRRGEPERREQRCTCNGYSFYYI